MKGKRVLVTGGTGGIGLAMATALADKGAEVIIISRNWDKCQLAAQSIQNQTGNESVTAHQADLSSQTEISELVKIISGTYESLDVLINNAGGFFWKRQESEDGIEMTFALNHLSYFLLSNLLLETLEKNSPGRIVNVSSGGHHSQELNLADLELKRNYFHFKAYGRSKLANLYFTYELSRRLEGKNLTVNAFNPGYVKTKIGQETTFGKIFMSLGYMIAIPPEEGAKTGIYLASSNEVEGISGKYYYQGNPIKSSSTSYDQDISSQLWQISAEMTSLG